MAKAQQMFSSWRSRRSRRASDGEGVGLAGGAGRKGMGLGWYGLWAAVDARPEGTR